MCIAVRRYCEYISRQPRRDINAVKIYWKDYNAVALDMYVEDC